MKKVLLTVLGSAMAVMAGAQVTPQRVTPAGYDFNIADGSIIENAYASDMAGVMATVANSKVTTQTKWLNNIFPAGFWNDEIGYMAIFGGQADKSSTTNLKNGLQMVDLRGDVGRTLAFIGSNVKDQVNAELAKHNLPELTTSITANGWLNVHFMLQGPSQRWDANRKMRLRIIANVYNGNVKTQWDHQQRAGLVVFENTNSLHADHHKAASNDWRKHESLNEGDWNLQKWVIYEYEFTSNTIVNNNISLQFAAGAVNNMALFIKEITVEYMDEPAAAANMVAAQADEAPAFFINTYFPAVGGEPTGVADIEADNTFNVTVAGAEATFTADATVYGIDGRAVATAKAGVPVALAKGVYIAASQSKTIKFAVR